VRCRGLGLLGGWQRRLGQGVVVGLVVVELGLMLFCGKLDREVEIEGI